MRLWSILLGGGSVAESAAQCLTDGKSIIMEGMHLDPGLYLYEFARYSQAHLTAKLSERKSLRSHEPKAASSEHGLAARSMPALSIPSRAAGVEAGDVRSQGDLRYAVHLIVGAAILLQPAVFPGQTHPKKPLCQ